MYAVTSEAQRSEVLVRAIELSRRQLLFQVRLIECW
jgi:hypothetical protein